MGPNCHLHPKYDKPEIKAELDILYDSLILLHEQGKVAISKDLQEQLCVENRKRCIFKASNLLTPQHRRAAKELMMNPGLVIRRADKSSIYVVDEEQ